MRASLSSLLLALKEGVGECRTESRRWSGQSGLLTKDPSSELSSREDIWKLCMVLVLLDASAVRFSAQQASAKVWILHTPCYCTCNASVLGLYWQAVLYNLSVLSVSSGESVS
ncbi:hypothetical protein RvY_13993 [Ramazzottius varieornatus]|uniref:Uncharacterized protein n=1 Tax=Ramazzottius varieornatus TaxID=947166 RepID=A0A1D1VPU6_RAMVA|nr:hypothetical protein RvY_13993 [Ramazzottius varieornatus]